MFQITMKNKYYTPETEEFHKGFEFEWDHNSFEKEVFAVTTDDDLEIIDDKIREGKIRVKLLNEKDIESFGWEFNTKSKSSKDELVITYWHPDKQCMLMFYTKKKFVIMEKLSKTHHSTMLRIFRGFIKNKSELQKLIIQLEIK